MKTIKTRSDKRSTYTYTDAMGVRRTLKPGDVDQDTGYVLTEEDIKRLHRMDDNEVYNNVKNTRAPIQEWEKPILEAWRKDHPGMDLPTRMHISIDISVENDEGKEEDADKGLIAKASMAAAKAEDPMLERLHEVAEMLEPERRLLYQRVIIDEESLTAIAEEEGVSVAAIHNRIEKIKKFIQKNF
jgi:DNA-directed RNA polymerase specialized sigma24 family protein